MSDRQCDRLVATSIDPAELTECGLPAEHEGRCEPDPGLLGSAHVDGIGR